MTSGVERNGSTGAASARNGRGRRLTAAAFDEYPLWLDTIARVVESVGVEMVGAASDVDQAIAILEERRPTLFVLGLERAAGKPDRAAALFEAASRVDGMSTIVVSSDNDPEFIEHCLEQGATAYVLKTIRSDDLSSAVRQAVDRCIYLFGTPRPHHNGELDRLTPREFEVLRQVSEGLSNAEVAQRLWISVATVKFHLTRTYEKLGVTNRTGAVRWAHRHGLLGAEMHGHGHEHGHDEHGRRAVSSQRRARPGGYSLSRG